MNRDTNKFKKSLEFHHELQLDEFNRNVAQLKAKAKWWKDVKGDLENWEKLLTQVEKMKFQFDKSSAMINYGTCTKFEKPVSFIPNTCQLKTQKCFKHRRDL